MADCTRRSLRDSSIVLCVAVAILWLLTGCAGSPTTSATPKATASAARMATTATTSATTARPSALYVGSNDHVLYALSSSDGSMRWRFPTGDAVTSQPVIANGLVYAASTDHSVYAVSAANGQQAWRTEVGWYPSMASIVDGKLYVGATTGVWGLDAATGAVRWHYEKLFSALTPVVAGGVVYVAGTDNGADVLLALGAADGVVRWRFDAGDYTMGFFTTPVIAGDTVYASNTNGNVYALRAGDGSLRWKTQLIHVVPGLSPLAVADGVIYVGGGNQGSDYRLFALRSADGTQLWSAKTDGFISAPEVSNGALYFEELLYGTGDGIDDYCYALRVTDGSQIWRAPLGHAAESLHSTLALTPPLLADGTVYLGSDDHSVYALSASDGTKRWRTDVNGYMSYLSVAP